MTPNDREAFCEIVLGFAELKGRSLSAPALELYWRAMQGWTLEDFKAAADHLVRTCEFMPGPDKFEELRNAGKATAAEAWDRAVQHASTGAWRKGPVGDETIDLVVRCLGGYQAIGLCGIEKLHFLERRFCEHFEALADRVETRHAVPQIAGTSTRALTRASQPRPAAESVPQLVRRP